MTKRTMWISAAAGGVVAMLLIFYGISPFFAAQSLGKALQSGDRDRLEQMIDFPSVRQNLKEDLRARMTASLQAESKKNALAAGLGMLIGPTIVDRAVDNLITPAMISTAIRNSRMSPGEYGARLGS